MPHKTYSAKASEIKHAWHLVDVSDQILGRAASQIASILKGKHKPMYTPSIDTGDNVVVINASKIRVTGKKAEAKLYYRHSLAGFPGGLKVTNFTKLHADKPEEIIVQAVGRMLPRSALGRQMMKKLKVYPGAEHPHAAQGPVALQLKSKAKE